MRDATDADARADEAGHLYVLFRSAHEMVHRDMYLLKSNDHGTTFTGSSISPWNVGYCVMSTEAFATGPNGVLAAWETENQVHFGRITDGGGISEFRTTPGNNQKYPSLVSNSKGFSLASWTEGMGWKRGGSVHWQIFDSSGQPVGDKGNADGVPVWSLIASYAQRDGHFVIVY